MGTWLSTSMFHSRGWPRLLLVLASVPNCGNDSAAPVAHSCDGLAAEQRTIMPRPVCPNDLPSESDCGIEILSYKTDVAAIFATRCGDCHGPDGIESTLPLSTYAQIFEQRRTVLSQVFTCLMPLPCATDLTANERAQVLKWMVCGSLNN